LVVGNSTYVNVPRLANPANDAQLMAGTLRALGFSLIGNRAHLDLDKAKFDSIVQTFGSELQGADVGLFYYAGHGVQVRGSNYLVPIGANPTREADVDFQMLDTNVIMRQMESAGTKLNLVILDACRNNPFGGRGLRATESGLAQMRAPEGTLISFATQPGNVALDGAGGNSPFTKALAHTIRRPGLGIFDAFNEVGLAVMKETGNAQQPWVSTSPIAGRFYFAGLPAAASSPAQVTAPPPPSSGSDEIAWAYLKSTTDYAQLRRFIEEHPSSPRKSEAEARYAALLRNAAGERRHVQQISFPNLDEAKKAAARIAAGTSFEAIALERGLKESDIDLGTISKSDLADRVVGETAFALKPGTVSEPVIARFGAALVRVLKVERVQ
jgi:hypothetical protein